MLALDWVQRCFVEFLIDIVIIFGDGVQYVRLALMLWRPDGQVHHLHYLDVGYGNSYCSLIVTFNPTCGISQTYDTKPTLS